jgi:hypothetical protein
MIKRWVTTKERIKQFEQTLVQAVKQAQSTDAKLAAGDHCRWCAAKPICPKMTGAVDRALQAQLKEIDVDMLGRYLKNADLLEDWIKDLRGLALQLLEKDLPVPGYKLVQKQARRQWKKQEDVVHWLDGKGLEASEIYNKELLSPAQMEKVLKKRKMALPDELVVAVSSGTTLASEDDPRPAVLQIGQQLSAALSKLQ